MFTGLSAFPITPFNQEVIDFKALQGLVENLASANVDSICAIGSTGLYPYLTREQKYDVAKLAVDHANGIPVMAGVGALRTYDVLKNVEAVQQAVLMLCCWHRYPIKCLTKKKCMASMRQ